MPVENRSYKRDLSGQVGEVNVTETLRYSSRIRSTRLRFPPFLQINESSRHPGMEFLSVRQMKRKEDATLSAASAVVRKEPKAYLGLKTRWKLNTVSVRNRPSASLSRLKNASFTRASEQAS